MIELNKMSDIEGKLDAIMNKMNNHERIIHSMNEVGIMEGVEQTNIVDQGLAHKDPYQIEEARYINGNMSYNFKPNNNLLTHYTPPLRNHENLSYGGGMQQGPRPAPYYWNYAQPGF